MQNIKYAFKAKVNRRFTLSNSIGCNSTWCSSFLHTKCTHRVMQFTLFLILPLLLVLIRAGSGDHRGHFESAGNHLSPDDTLFVHLRCFELFAAASNDQSSDRERDASDWLLATNSSYMRKTDRSPGFLNCVLTKLQLYDDHQQLFKVACPLYAMCVSRILNTRKCIFFKDANINRSASNVWQLDEFEFGVRTVIQR